MSAAPETNAEYLARIRVDVTMTELARIPGAGHFRRYDYPDGRTVYVVHTGFDKRTYKRIGSAERRWADVVAEYGPAIAGAES